MNKQRKVGTFTAGLSLVIFGILFALRPFFDNFNLKIIIACWPFVFILLGMEMLISYFTGKNETYKLDFVSVIIIFAMLFFAVALAGAEFVLNYQGMQLTF